MQIDSTASFSEETHVAINGFSDRLLGSEAESDTALMYDLLILGELITKLTVIAAVACVGDDLDRTRYGFEYRLLRSDSIGAWEKALSDVLTGPANALVRDAARPFVSEVTRNFVAADAGVAWRRDALEEMNRACAAIDPTLDRQPA